MRVRILMPTGGYTPGQVLDLPGDMVAEWLAFGLAELEQPEEPETAVTKPAKREKAVSRGRKK